MGLHLWYEMSLPADCGEDDVASRVALLHQHALTLPFGAVPPIVRFDERAVAASPPLRGLAFESLEHVVQLTARHQRDLLYREWVDFRAPGFRASGSEGPSRLTASSLLIFGQHSKHRRGRRNRGLSRLTGPITKGPREDDGEPAGQL